VAGVVVVVELDHLSLLLLYPAVAVVVVVVESKALLKQAPVMGSGFPDCLTLFSNFNIVEIKGSICFTSI
jgi:hypothetical protein